MKNLDHIISFVCAKQLLESMRLLVTWLQENFAFKKTEELIYIYKLVKRTDEIFQSVYAEAVSSANEFGFEVTRNGQNRVDSVTISCIAFAQIKLHSGKKSRHILTYAYFFVCLFVLKQNNSQ